MTPEQLREVLWVVFEKDGNDLFCSTHSQLVKDRHQQLIEEFPDQGPYEVRKYVPYVTHADALEENKRLAAKVAELETALLGIKQYREKNPLGGPAKVFDAMADQIRAGDDFNKVIADYGWCPVSRAERAEAALAESERKCERLKFHADAMAVGDRLAAKDYVLNGDAWNARAEYLQAVKRYRADKEAK